MNKAVGFMDKAYGAGLIHPDLAHAINVAGRQRMLSQKALKEYMEAEHQNRKLRHLAETGLTVEESEKVYLAGVEAEHRYEGEPG